MAITRDMSSTLIYPRKWVADGFVANDLKLSLNLPGSRVCQSVPGYREIIRNGGNATGPYSLTASKVERYKEGSWSVSTTGIVPSVPETTNTHRVTGIASNLSVPVANNTLPSKAEAIALASAYRKIRQETERLNTLASAAEFTDVVRQFGAPFAALVDLSNKRLNRLELERRGLKGSIVFKKAKWARIVASTWLEYAFGLAPLISDTRKVAEAYARFQNDEELSKLLLRSKIVARGSDDLSIPSYNSSLMFSSWVGVRRTTVDTQSSRCQYVVGLNAPLTPDFGSNERLMQLLGIRAENLIPAAWEALPWSWLLDYFTNIGSILEAASTSTANVSWVSKTTTVRLSRKIVESLDYEVTKSRVAALSRKITGTYNQTGETEIVSTTLTRQSAQLGVPPLSFELPTQAGQLANMAAVLLARREKTSALWLF